MLERAVGDDGVACDKQVAHLAGRPEHESGDRVSDVGDVVSRPDGDVGRRTHFETAEIGTAETPGAARGGELECLARRQGVG